MGGSWNEYRGDSNVVAVVRWHNLRGRQEESA